MGLDAVVYKHRSKLPVDPERAGLRLEEPTGEWYSETGTLPEPIRGVGVEALHKRLGNATLIAMLNREVGKLLPVESILISAVLYESGHAGDVLALDKVGVLKQEITLIRECDSTVSPELTRFLNDLEELAVAAEENRNPIAFT